MQIFGLSKRRKILIGGLVASGLLGALALSLLIIGGGVSGSSKRIGVEEEKRIGEDKAMDRSSQAAGDSAHSDVEARKHELNEIKELEPKVIQEDSLPRKTVVAWQPSHQDDTGMNWHEYLICGDIVDRAITFAAGAQNVKCWDLSHGLTGSNNYRPAPINTIAFDNEIAQANQAGASYFISVHNDGGAPSGVLGEYLPGDEKGKKLAEIMLKAVCTKTGLPNRGLRAVRLYSLEPERNKAEHKCLLEIGDNARDRTFLEDPAQRELVGRALAEAVNDLPE